MTWFVPALVNANAEEAPDEVALIDDTRAWTWRELSRRADAVADGIVGRGVRPGDRVTLVASTSLDTVAALVGILRAGAVAAPIPPGLTAREVDVALEVVEPALVLRDGDVYVDGGWAGGGEENRDPEAPAVLVMTSGTTGRPKWVVLSSRAMAASADAWLAALPPVTGWAMPLGLGHVAGLGILWRAIRGRVPVRMIGRADPAGLLVALGSAPPLSHLSLVPAQLARLLDAAGDAPPPASLRAVLLGGGPIPPALVTRAVRAGWPVVATYGLSETGSGATALSFAEALDHPGSAGRPLPGSSILIEDMDADGVGEIVVETEARFSGYLGEAGSDATAPAMERVRTGDLGRLDDDGRLYVVDRRLDRIVRGGENIAPAEVEAVLLVHPAVADAVVVGLSDPPWGHVPAAAIVLADGAADPGDEALTIHCRASLAGFKVPVAFLRLDVLPRTPGGKPRRDAVRALLAGERTGELERPGGARLGWRVTGEGPLAVILLHGTLSNARQLDRLAATLARHGDLAIHALDRRGSGTGRLAQGEPVAGLDLAVHLVDIVAYLDARGIGRAAVVGVSFGGVLGIELAARHPDRVAAVVAFEPPYGPLADESTQAAFQALAGAVADAHRTGGGVAAAETFLRAVAGDAAWDRLSERSRGFLAREGDGAAADAALTGARPDGLASIAAAVTVLTGGASEPFYGQIADALAARIPGARRDTLDGLDHPSPITQPAPMAAAVRAALVAAGLVAPDPAPAPAPTPFAPEAPPAPALDPEPPA